jgi:hypothetical protein
MAVDTGLWLLLAAGVALIWCGCIFTEGHGDRIGP